MPAAVTGVPLMTSHNCLEIAVLRITALLLCLLLVLAAPATAAASDDYSDPAYAESDADTMSRSLGRQRDHLTSPDYGQAFLGAAADSWLQAQGRQANDLRHGRIYTGAGQLVPGGAVGDPERYHAVTTRRVFFLSRTGAKLSGRIWGSEAPGPRPAVVITTGSIQGTEHMYWWAARALAARGYVVFTWDVQGQGESEGFGHAPGSPTPSFEGFPSQQADNFVDGTIDALRFFYSTPSDPYVPGGWSEEDVAAARAATDGERLDWVNPGWVPIDRTRLGLAGHSLGGSAVSIVQQCSDAAQLWRELDVCLGQSFPIRTVIGWDGLSGGGVTPVVPGMDQRADGYFFNPTPSFTAPNPDGALAAYSRWRDAGLDAMTLVVRGGTHLEWTELPYILPATSYGTELATYYTVAWMDRWVPGSIAVQRAAHAALLEGPIAEAEDPWSANHLSVRRRSALSLRPPAVTTGPFHLEVADIREWAGRSAVGDWEGANADTQGRELP
jgi:dienelactone hydrolase